MTKIFIDIFMYLFEFLMVFYYSDILFSEKKNRNTRIVMFLLNTTFLGCVYQLNITYLNIALMFLSYTLLFYFLYDISFKTALFHSLLFLIVMFATEIITSIIGVAFFDDFNALEKNISAYVFVTVISKLLYFSIMMVILKFLAQKESTDNKFFWLLFVMPLSSMFILICFRYITYQITLTQIMNVLWIVSCIGILFANILVFVIYEFSLKNSNELHEIKEIQRQQEQDEKYYEILEQTNKEMHLFSHDIKNHLIQIRNLEDINAVQDYVDKLYPNIEHFSRIGISKNKMLDLSTLMNNILDNAIEAAEKSNSKFVQLYLFSKNAMYDGLLIKNSCDFAPINKDGILKTTKNNKSFHGFGTKSIKNIIKKYDAIYDWKYDEKSKIFETNIVFSKK